MSLYAHIVCHACKQTIWLGKAIRNGEHISYFHIGDAKAVPNYENPLLTRSLWKFLAGHVRHSIMVIVEGDEGYDAIGDYQEIGGDEIADISFENYLAGWQE